jgi:hypothetical protein
MSSKPIEFAVTFITAFESAFIRLILDMNIRVTSQMCFADEAFVTLRTLKRLVVRL